MSAPTRSEQAVLLVLVATFLSTALLWSDHTWLVAGPGLVAIVCAWLVARRLGPATNGQEMLAVFLGAFAVVGLPSTSRTPIHLDTWVAIGLGILTTEAAWAVWRFPNRPLAPVSAMAALRESIPMALGAALLYSLLAAVLLGIGMLTRSSGTHFFGVMGTLVAGYFIGGLLAALVVGVLRKLTASPLGTMLVGMVAGTCIYGAVSPAAEILRGLEGKPASSMPMQIGVAIACGVLAGPPAALLIRADPVA